MEIVWAIASFFIFGLLGWISFFFCGAAVTLNNEKPGNGYDKAAGFLLILVIVFWLAGLIVPAALIASAVG